MNESPRLWIPRTKILEPNRELVFPTHIKGFYQLTARGRDGRVHRQTEVFPNLIVTQGKNYIGQLATWLSDCCVGTGNASPSSSDTQLGTQVAATATVQGSSQSIQSSSPYFGTLARTYRFAAGVAAGNLTEVGVGPHGGGNVLVFSRALILDGMGSPTTFTVLSDEVLDVTYILRQYPSTEGDVSDTISITGVGSVDFTVRAANATTAGSWAPPNSSGAWISSISQGSAYETQTLGAITGRPAGTSSGYDSGSSSSYSSGNFYRDNTLNWSLTAANFVTGVGSISVAMGVGTGGGAGGEWQISFTSGKIAKTSSKTLALTFRHAWTLH